MPRGRPLLLVLAMAGCAAEAAAEEDECDHPADAGAEVEGAGASWRIGHASLTWHVREDGGGTTPMSLIADLAVSEGGSFDDVAVNDVWAFWMEETWHPDEFEVGTIEGSPRVQATGGPQWEAGSAAKVVLELGFVDGSCRVVGREEVPVDVD